jgi:isopropylmalate/homocitrate/citramalate synthase
MARWDREKRILYHEISKFEEPDLRDVSEPNLFRSIFPYEEIPRIDFDQKIIPINPPKGMYITDTTFRDGQQARPPFAPDQIETIYRMLHRLGGPEGVIRQCEFFLYSQKDREAVERCLALDYRFPEVTAWIRANRDDLRLVKEMGLKETGMLMSVSDYHIFLKLKKNRRQALEDYLGLVKAALNYGIVPRCHFEDVTRADIYGFCVPLAKELMKLREESGIDIKIRLCDTLGFGVTYPGAALPRAVDKLVRAMIDDAGVPGRLLEWHGHNDFHKALINATTAWLYGCSAANGALFGLGERTGNTPVEALVIEYISLRGRDDGMDTRVISEIAEYMQREMGIRIPPSYPFVGSECNATSAGVHVDGILKNQEIYSIFNTQKFLNRPLTVVITDKSGMAGIVHWINTHLRLEGDRQVDKRHPGVAKIHKAIMKQYDEGRTTAIGSDEMRRLVKKYLPEYFVSDLQLLKQKAAEVGVHLIEELAERPEIRSMDPAQQEPLMEALAEENPFIQWVYVTNMEGRITTKIITQIVDRAKYPPLVIEEDYSDRPWFIGPLKDGRTYVTDFYISRFTHQLAVTVSAPIRNEMEEIVGILAADMKFEELLKMVEEDGRNVFA